MSRTLAMSALQTGLALAHSRWQPRRGAGQEGYSILLPVPADLPLFYRLALGTLSRQTLRHANEIVVLPDSNLDAFRRLVEATEPAERPVPIRYVPSAPWRDRLQRLVASPHYNHFTQIARGVDAALSRYLFLHDADLFLTEPGFLDRQYREAASKTLSLLGISGAKDDWYRENGFRHVAATWEVVFQAEWARRFKPCELRSGMRSLDGRRRKHDTMLFAQCRTPPREIEWATAEAGFVHFNYVICTYRDFIKSRRRFEDRRFIVPLLRLLIDRFDPAGAYPEVPLWDEIVRCLDGTADRIRFPEAEAGRSAYAELRWKLGAFCRSDFVTPAQATAMEKRLEAFDRIYAPADAAREPRAARTVGAAS